LPRFDVLAVSRQHEEPLNFRKEFKGFLLLLQPIAAGFFA